jgi:hypothetical protein
MLSWKHKLKKSLQQPVSEKMAERKSKAMVKQLSLPSRIEKCEGQ